MARKPFEVWSAFNTQVISASEAVAQGDLKPGQQRVIRSDKDTAADRVAAMRAHGFCVHFRLEDGQKQIAHDRLWERLRNEEKYDLGWFVAHLQGYGICDVFEGLAVNAMSPGKVPTRYLDSGCPFHLRDTSVPCPHWEDRKEKGKGIMSGRYAKRDEQW
jgi:hypothetical protein